MKSGDQVNKIHSVEMTQRNPWNHLLVTQERRCVLCRGISHKLKFENKETGRPAHASSVVNGKLTFFFTHICYYSGQMKLKTAI